MSFREVRHILNTAQIHSISSKIKLITLDADGIKKKKINL